MAEAVSLVEYVVGCLVDCPDEVRVTKIDGDDKTIIELRVADVDVGKVIGKSGTVARALRTLLSALGSRDDTLYSLEIID